LKAAAARIMFRTVFQVLFQSLYLRVRHRSRRLKVGALSTFENVTFGDFNAVYNLARLRDVHLGSFSYVANGARITHATIGKFCSVGPNCKIGVGLHPSRNFVSTHPAFYSPKNEAGTTFVAASAYTDFKRIIIENDVWVGESAIVMDGVTIANGAIVAAGAVVTRDVPPYAVVAGVPARIIRYRFEAQEIATLEALQWWHKDIEWLKSNVVMFSDINFITRNTDAPK
jgi:acetyltransferase-like isoleucine patch superfamily enzyme